jgi:hypothetical protein
VREVQKAIGELPPDAFTSPDRVAAAVLTVVDVDRPPRRLVTGSTAVVVNRRIRVAEDRPVTSGSTDTAVRSLRRPDRTPVPPPVPSTGAIRATPGTVVVVPPEHDARRSTDKASGGRDMSSTTPTREPAVAADEAARPVAVAVPIEPVQSAG